MNFAFPALLVFILALPGIIFRYNYRKGTWTTPIYREQVTEEIAWSLTWTASLHFSWIFLCNNLGYEVDIMSVLTLLLPVKDESTDKAISLVANSAEYIF